MTPSEIQSIKQRFGIIGNAPALNYAIQVAAQVAPTDMTVLISGESGSGKESFSKRRLAEVIAVQQKHNLIRNQRAIGQVHKVLVENFSKRSADFLENKGEFSERRLRERFDPRLYR